MAARKQSKKTRKAKKQPKAPVLLQILPALQAGGVERGTLEIAKAAKEAGFTSLVASSGGKLEQDLYDMEIEHIRLPLNKKGPYAIWKNAKALADIIRKYRVDILHARSRGPAWSAYLACKRTAGCHFMTTFHGTYGTEGLLKRKYNRIMTQGKRVIAISHFIAEHIKQTYGDVEEQRLRIIPRGVDLKAFRPKKINKEILLPMIERWKIPEDVPLILMPARFTEWKGHIFLLNALSKLNHRNFYCVMLGSRNGHERYYDRVKQAMLDLRLAGNVMLADHCYDMPTAYYLSHVVMMPSTRPEAFGRVAVEAQAMGKPVIACSHGGALETIKDGKTGWLVKPNDVAGLAEIIDEALLLDDDKYTKMANAARAHVRKYYDIETMQNDTIAVYKELLKEQSEG